MTDVPTELQLIALVRSRPVLWDKSSDKYRHPSETKSAWVDVCRKLNENYESLTHEKQEKYVREIVKKWSNLRDALVKSLKKGRKYVYSDELQFLSNQYETVPLEGEIKEGEDDSQQHLPLEIDSRRLISFVRQWPCLWDKSHESYKDRSSTMDAWWAVARELNPDFDQLESLEQEHYRREAVKKWNNMRDTYAKSVKRSSYHGAFKAKKYVHADEMSFLRRYYTTHDDSDEEWVDGTTMEEEVAIPDPPDILLEERIEETLALPWVFQAKAVTDCQEGPADQQERQDQEPNVPNPKKRKTHKRHESGQEELEEVDQRILSLLERLEPESRHMSFFKGILPSLERFDEDEVLQFQIQVLEIISSMRNRRKGSLAKASHVDKARQKPHVESDEMF